MALSMKSSKKPSKAELINRLLDRGIEDVIDKDHLRKALTSGKKLRVKFGIDPTSPNIHLGRAIPLRKLRDFQRLGHKVVLIIGDFTAQVGDPSDKAGKRPMLKREAIKEYLRSYKKQLGKIIDLKNAEIVYNSSWLKKLGFQEISELAENFSVQQMLERRNFKDRFDSHIEISLREFMYPLMQGYDSVAVRADVEIGGFDQLFNLMAGRVIQRAYGQKEQDIMTFQMLEGTDGRKMSSSWGNVISLLDSPNDMFGKIMALKDELIVKYFILATDVSESEIESLKELAENRPKEAKVRLGREIVALYHGEKAAEEAAAEFDRVFVKRELPSEIEEVKAGASSLEALDLIFAARLVSSKSEGRRLIEQGGLEIAGDKIKDPKTLIKIPEEGVIIKAGKRRFSRIFP